MIPALGVMIGAYIITKMIDTVVKETDRAGGATPAGVAAALTIAVTVVSVVVIIKAGIEAGAAAAEAQRALGDLLNW